MKEVSIIVAILGKLCRINGRGLIFVAIGLISSCATFQGWIGGRSGSKFTLDVAKFPARPSSAPTGSAFIKSILALNMHAREQAIFREIKRGNVPGFLRQLKPVMLRHVYGGKTYTGYVYVMPDYLSIGSDTDYVRMPMTPVVAQRIADLFGMSIPSRKLVNDIYRQADVKLTPQTMPPGRMMTSSEYYRRHNQMIHSQLRGRGRRGIVAGHKKDIVVTNRLLRLPTRVAIYGWHRPNGIPIQPLSLVHGEAYADYSHGVRMIGGIMRVGKYKMYVREVMKDRKLSGLVSDEGVIRRPELHSDYKLPLRESLSSL